MKLNESIVEDAPLMWFGALGFAAQRSRKAIWRLNGNIP